MKKRKADAAIAARLGAAGEAPVNPSPTARHITGGSQQGAYFPSGPVWKSTSELGYFIAWTFVFDSTQIGTASDRSKPGA